MAAMAHRLIGLMTQTPLHAGAGSATEVIDLPIQREAHTDWPCVYGSSMKGALRAAAETHGDLSKERITTLFGPNTEKASDHAGNLLVSDARLLLLPVRSLTGHYRWVTCPALLRRCLRDAQRCGHVFDAPTLPEVAKGEALVAGALSNQALYLEEFSFTPRVDDSLSTLAELIAVLVEADREEEIVSQLTLVDDDSFRHLCRNAIPVQPHIRLKNDTKTVADGALWYEENISPDTLFYWTLTAQPSRNAQDDEGAPDAMLGDLLGTLFPVGQAWLQVGGNETVGMGWCQIKEVRDGQV